MSFGDYLDKQDEKTIKEAMPHLIEIAGGEGAWWMRMGAVNSIIKIKSKYTDESKSLESKIKSTEDTAELADLNQRKNKVDEMKEWIIEELKQLSEAETNANLKRILEGSLN